MELAARELIDYAKELLTEHEFPQAVAIGGSYECDKNFFEWLVGINDFVDNPTGAERIMAGIVALGLDLDVRPIRNWQHAVKEWEKYCDKHPSSHHNGW